VWVRRQMPSTAAEEAVKEVKQALSALDPKPMGGRRGRRHRHRRGAEAVLPEPGTGRVRRRLHQPGQRGDGGSRALPEQVPARRAGGAPLRAGRAGPPHRSRDDAGGGEFQGAFGRLTIDRNIQHVAESELQAAVGKYNAAAAWPWSCPPGRGDPRDGDGAFVQPERPARGPTEARKNRSLTDSFEPGSTFRSLPLPRPSSSGR